MMRKLMVTLSVGIIFLLSGSSVLAKIRMPSPMQYATLTEYEKATGKAITKFHEAPMLRVKVAAGELPPVEERLPEEPLVLIPVEEIGQYGGTWHRAWTGPSDAPGPGRITVDNILRHDPDGKKVLPNIARAWKLSDEGRTLTLYLRKGMKWSDGVPFTADDIIFWYKDIILNDELTPAKPSWMIVGGKLGEVEKIDDYTVRLHFVQPYGVLLDSLAIYGGQGGFFAPRHYLKQFHPNYTSEERLEKMVKEEGFNYWYQLFMAKNDWIQNPDLPTLRAWKPINEPTATHWIMERNPYYWKVDTAGNQLPYLDRVTHVLAEDPEVINLKAMAGELDFQLRHLMLNNYPMFMEASEKGNYRVVTWESGFGSDVAFSPNLTYKGDPVLRDIIRDRRFRIALSLAINREEINELCYLGLGEIRAATVPPQNPAYREEFGKKYIEYNPERANALLDEMGLRWDKDHKYRLRPDGKTLSLTIEVVAGIFGPWVDASELVKEYWEEIGIKTAVKTEERALWYQRLYAGEIQVAVWSFGQVLFPIIRGLRLIPFARECPFAPLIGEWYVSRGKSGVEPWGDLKKVLDLWEKAKLTVDREKRIQLTQEILRINAENVWNIGILRAPATMCMGVLKNNFRNVPEVALSDTNLNSPGNANPPQFFFKQK